MAKRAQPPSPRRRYVSPKRTARAAGTRRTIAASARRLFHEHGYQSTSIEAIAGAAGVAVQTVYATYRTKRAILMAILEDAEAMAAVDALLQRLRDHGGQPARQLADLVAFTVRFHRGAIDLVEIARAAGAADRDLAHLWQEGEGRRRKGQAPIVREWARQGFLAPGLSATSAADVLWALTGADAYRLFVVECEWRPRRFAVWLEATLSRLLLSESARVAAHRSSGGS